MPDILADYREWREQQAIRVSTHSDGCHMWHEQCMIHRLADALAVEQAKRAASEAEIDALEYVVEEGRIACKEDYGILRSWLCRLRPAWESTPDEPSTPGEGTRQERCTLTVAEREAILYCVSCAQDYRDRLDGSEERATQMIQTAMRVAMPHVGPAPVEGQRTASVTDVGGAGPT